MAAAAAASTTTTTTTQQQQSQTLSATDPTLAPFLAPSFSPTTYLNSVLPTWPTIQQQQAAHTQSQTALSQLPLDAQDLLSRLTTQLTRLTTTLTTLTDEILRSGSRLAYEVEVLRGDAGGLHDALHADTSGGLKDEFRKLGVDIDGYNGLDSTSPSQSQAQAQSQIRQVGNSNGVHTSAGAATQTNGHEDQPEYIRTLRTLTTVRANLDSVVSVFGAAIDWVMPPSEVSARSGNASSTATGSAGTGNGAGASGSDLETQGREFAARLKDEIAVLLDGGVGPTALADGVESAEKRVAELRELLVVWKGTVEERPRTRFVDGLAKTVEEFREKKGV